jgi:hypothetical protein
VQISSNLFPCSMFLSWYVSIHGKDHMIQLSKFRGVLVRQALTVPFGLAYGIGFAWSNGTTFVKGSTENSQQEIFQTLHLPNALQEDTIAARAPPIHSSTPKLWRSHHHHLCSHFFTLLQLTSYLYYVFLSDCRYCKTIYNLFINSFMVFMIDDLIMRQ